MKGGNDEQIREVERNAEVISVEKINEVLIQEHNGYKRTNHRKIKEHNKKEETK